MPTQLIWAAAPKQPEPGLAPPEGDPARKLIGRLLDDRFHVEGVLGRGGMGVVYEGTDHVLERPIVVKVLAPAGAAGDVASGERLVREARLACRVEHPSIVTVFHLGLLETGEPYVVMERLRGVDLAELLTQRTRFTIEETIAVLEPVADALDALHAARIVHRDVKPENVLVLGGRLDRPRVKLIDFGLAFLDDELLTRMTRAGRLIGTAEYIAPECARGAPATPAADVYALATLAYELLTGKAPFEGHPMDVLVAKTNRNPPALREAHDDARLRRLEAVIARGLARDPAQRPSALDLVRGIREAARADETARMTPQVREEAPPAPVAAPPSAGPVGLAWLALGTAALALLTALVSLVAG